MNRVRTRLSIATRSLLALSLLVVAASANAEIVIDEFLSDVAPTTEPAFPVGSGSDLLGGEADADPRNGFVYEQSGGLALMDGGGGDVAQLFLFYDGIDGSTDPAFGLGGVDLTDGGTLGQFLIDLDAVSAPERTSIEIRVFSGQDLANYQRFVLFRGEILGADQLALRFEDSTSEGTGADFSDVSQIEFRFNLDPGDSLAVERIVVNEALGDTEVGLTSKVNQIPGLDSDPSGTYRKSGALILPQVTLEGDFLLHDGGSFTFSVDGTSYTYGNWTFELLETCASGGDECLVQTDNGAPWALRRVNLQAGTADMVFTESGAMAFNDLAGEDIFSAEEKFGDVNLEPAIVIGETEARQTSKVNQIPGLDFGASGTYQKPGFPLILAQTSQQGDLLFHDGGAFSFSVGETSYTYGDWTFELLETCASDGDECLVQTDNGTPWALREIDLQAGTAVMVFTESGAMAFNDLAGDEIFEVEEKFADVTVILAIDWVTVGDPGNACDTQPQDCFGSVAEPYQISRFEVTNAQYAEFLNAVAATDTNALYSTRMGSGPGGITQMGSPGSYTYSTIVGREEMPVNHVSFWDATRFANWLHNGQPIGVQDDTTTEDGAYTLTPTGIENNTVTRNAEAEVFVPSEDEWYKAAYYDTGAREYFDYPAGSDTQTTCTLPGPTANTANCDDAVGDLTDVGSYTGAASPSGTFDQGGNAWEWHETIIDGEFRGLRGGRFPESPFFLQASVQFAVDPTFEDDAAGFRVARVPEPNAVSLQLAALLGLLGYRRLRAQHSD